MKEKISHIALLGFLGIIMPACSDGPEYPEKDPEIYITFAAPQLDLSFGEGEFTRAELVDDIKEFTVWGYCIPRDASGNVNKTQASATWDKKSDFFTSGADVLDGYTVTVDGNKTSYDHTNNGGGTSNPKQWYRGEGYTNAANYNYGFIGASSPYGKFSMSHSSVAGEAHPVLTFSLDHITSNDLSEQLNYTQQPDALIGKKFDQFCNSKVRLAFHHIMTGLRFRFHNECTATESDQKDLVIHKVTFSGTFYKTAEFSFENENIQGKVTGDTYSGTFVLLDRNQTITAGTSDLMRHEDGRSVKLLLLPNPNATLAPSEEDIDDWALGKNKQITIEYSFNNGTRKTFSTSNDFRLSYIPGPNTLHTANFHFLGEDFVVTFQPDNDQNWENGSDSNLEIH